MESALERPVSRRGKGVIYPQAGFRRSFLLNKKVLVEEISATYQDGVLKVLLPKNPETNSPVYEITVDG